MTPSTAPSWGERVAQFRDQVRRRLAGELTEDEFKPLRLMNGLYLQLHAYMLRVAIPYGVLSSVQLRKLAHLARAYDRDYGHFTTRQNIQFNWPRLEDVPDMLDELSEVEMHAIQTSGNCIRNVTADQFAGVAADEIDDPRVYAELIRQWSTLHPEFSFLPRKFKIAVTGAARDRAAIRVHDIGLRMVRDDAGEAGFEVVVGGGQGRTPMIGHVVRAFLPVPELLTYLEAILRVYNELGRRDNLFKARIKILVHQIGPEAFTRLVEEEFAGMRREAPAVLPGAELARIRASFAPPPLCRAGASRSGLRGGAEERRRLRRLGPDMRLRAQAAGLCHRDDLAQAHRRRARRCHVAADGHGRRARRPLRFRRNPRHARTEPGAAGCGPARSSRAVAGARTRRSGDAQCRTGDRHHRLSGARLLQSGQCPLDPDRPGDRRALRGSGAPARHRRGQDQDLGLHQRLRPPPMWGISASLASTGRGSRSTR